MKLSAKTKIKKAKKGGDDSLYEDLILSAIEREPRRPKTIVKMRRVVCIWSG